MNGTYANNELQDTIRQEEQHDPTDLVISQWLGPFSPRARSIQDHWHYTKADSHKMACSQSHKYETASRCHYLSYTLSEAMLMLFQ